MARDCHHDQGPEPWGLPRHADRIWIRKLSNLIGNKGNPNGVIFGCSHITTTELRNRQFFGYAAELESLQRTVNPFLFRWIGSNPIIPTKLMGYQCLQILQNLYASIACGSWPQWSPRVLGFRVIGNPIFLMRKCCEVWVLDSPPSFGIDVHFESQVTDAGEPALDYREVWCKTWCTRRQLSYGSPEFYFLQEGQVHWWAYRSGAYKNQKHVRGTTPYGSPIMPLKLT